MLFTNKTPAETGQKEHLSFASLRRVVVVGGISLLDQGVFRMLSARQDLEVFYIDGSADSDLQTRVEQIHPDMFILCHTPKAVRDRLTDLLDDLPHLADTLIISIDLLNMNLDIYEHQRWFTADQEAFFDLLGGCAGDDGPPR